MKTIILLTVICCNAMAFEVYTNDQGEPLRWTKSVVTYSFSKKINKVRRKAVRDALQEWSDIVRIEFSEIDSAGDISFEVSDRKGHNLPSLVLADTTGDFSGSDITHATVTLNLFNAITKRRLKTVCLHEIGHALGIAHSSDPNALMYPAIGTTSDLMPDDIQAGEFLYKNWM